MITQRPSRSLARFLLLITGSLAVAGASRPASAEDPVTVHLSDLGPDRSLPLGKSFILAGNAPGPGKATEAEKNTPVDEVRGIFVRTSYPLLGTISLGAETNCRKVAETLKAPKDDEPTALGPMTADQIWEAGSSGMPAFRLSTWKRGKPEENAYKLSVPADGFFRPGATYCLFVYTKGLVKADTSKLDAAIATFRTDWAKCKDSSCQTLALEALDTEKIAFLQDNKTLGKDAIADVTDAIAKLRAVGADITGNDLAGKLRLYNTAYQARPAAPVPTPPIVWVDASTDPLARFVLLALGRSGEIYASVRKEEVKARSPGPKPGAPTKAADPPSRPILDYYLADGRIGHLGFGAGHTLFVSEQEPSATVKPKPLKVALDKLRLPDSTISVLDLLEYADGRVRVAGTSIRFDAVYEDSLKDLLNPPFTEGAAKAGALVDQIDALREAIQRSLGVVDAPSPPALSPAQTSSAEVYKLAGEWLRTRILQSCAKIHPNNGKLCDASGSGGWPGFKEFDTTPIVVLSDTMGVVVRSATKNGAAAQKKLDALKKSTQLKLTVTSETAIRLTKDTWFAHYVTPTVGLALITGASESFGAPYGGLKVYGFPNPVDEPMWINGSSDVYRMFALEVGLISDGGDIGPDGRFTGLAGGDFPPVLVGGALQLLPYISVSAGAGFFSARRSVLTNEAYELFVSPYFAISGDVNFLDLFASALGKARSTSVDSVVKK